MSHPVGLLAMAWLFATLLMLGHPDWAAAQVRDVLEEEANEPAAPPEPENVSLKTRDRFLLKATYYGSLEGKQAVPLVLLHDFKGSRHDYDVLAETLQQEHGFAVVVPDLRGHGDSLRFEAGNEFGSATRASKLEATRLRRDDCKRMITCDLEAVRRFLIEENNAGRLNLNKLCVVGAGMGTVLAFNWTMADWSAPRLVTGKQGQDVKGLVLVSPSWDFKGLPIKQAIAHPALQQKVAMLIVVGSQKTSAARDAKRLYKMLEASRPHMATGDQAGKDLFYVPAKTSLQGAKLIKNGAIKMDALIAKFVQLRIADQDFPWLERVTSRN